MSSKGWTVHGFDGNDNIKGRIADDLLFGDNGNDVIYGNDGNDHISGGAGNDRYGDGGDDHFDVSGKLDGYDRFDGGIGIDTVHATSDNTVIGLVSIAGVEAITADGHAGVIIKGTSLADTLDFSATTLSGIGYIDMGSGNDIVIGSAGADSIKGNAGDDRLGGGAGIDYLYGGEGVDTFVFDAAALTSRDIVRDFSTIDGDKLELNGILEGYDPVSSAITDFVRITESGTTSYLSVDKDGAAGPSGFVQVGRFDSVVSLTDEQSLLTSGRLIIS